MQITFLVGKSREFEVFHGIVKRWCRDIKCGGQSCENVHTGEAPTTVITKKI